MHIGPRRRARARASHSRPSRRSRSTRCTSFRSCPSASASGSPSGAWPVVAAMGAYAVCIAVLFFAVGPMSLAERHTAGLLVPALLCVMVAPSFALGARAAQAWVLLLLASNVAATMVSQVAPLAKD